MNYISYEKAVQLIRAQPGGNDWAKACYLEEDVFSSAQRFSQSEEFEAVAIKLNLKKRKDLRVLDLGCGNGIASYAIANLGHHVTALDPDRSELVGLGVVQHLRQILSAGSITIECSFAESLPLENDSYDVIYARQALHHFQSLEKSMKECYRVLRKDGFFFATREHIAENEEELELFLGNHVLHKLHGGENAYPESYYIQCFERAGFNVLKVFRGYDTVINHYPLSKLELDNLFLKFLRKKVGLTIASRLVKYASLKQLYKKYLSKKLRVPGMAFSFLCQKT